ncbi:hypothetical protein CHINAEXTREME_17075 [Halobiforma lacisalsi AJ5]|uniref:Uncharacterized protein n=1 Tax=Natronobacterium lacisalsi AJ5 TaxID=358396 RepID=M0LPZ1_NATLA|nr:hypothetical protein CHINAEXTREME_17075 [Halobiforma lacisalsi AJ5]EMA35188.1 hypothetical protein C445_05698 [Halobiforma lacisalsi AJ5]
MDGFLERQPFTRCYFVSELYRSLLAIALTVPAGISNECVSNEDAILRFPIVWVVDIPHSTGLGCGF